MSTHVLTLTEHFIPPGHWDPLEADPSHSQGSAGLGHQAWALTGHGAGPAGVQGKDAWVGWPSGAQRRSGVDGRCFRGAAAAAPVLAHRGPLGLGADSAVFQLQQSQVCKLPIASPISPKKRGWMGCT